MRVNEIFYSIQGEGFHAGRAAIFVRLSGCNLKCPFCDTEHQTFTEMSEDEVMYEILKYECDFVVITGGEPTLQLTESFIDRLHDFFKYVAIETNGTREIPKNVDWVTVSPKTEYVGIVGAVNVKKADEVKIIISESSSDVNAFGIRADNYYIQPCDTGDEVRNREIQKKCVELVKNRPLWKLSIQQQKILNVR